MSPTLTALGEGRVAVGIPRERAVADQPRSSPVADEERGDRQLEFIDEVGRQELREHGSAAFDQERAHAPVVQFADEIGHGDLVAQPDDGRTITEPVADAPDRGSAGSRPTSSCLRR